MPKYRFTLVSGDKVEAEAPMPLNELISHIGQHNKDCPMVIQTSTKAFVMSAVVMVEDMTSIAERELLTQQKVNHWDRLKAERQAVIERSFSQWEKQKHD